MSRSAWKFPLILNKKIPKFFSYKKIFNKNLFISANLLEKNLLVYDGRKFITRTVSDFYLGFKIGDLIETRTRTPYKKKSN